MDQAAKLRKKLQQFKLKQAKTYAVISGKGGVGKSNIVLNIALTLSKYSRKVMLIDSDIGMANIELLLGQPASNASIVEMVEGFLPFEQCMNQGPFSLSYMCGGTSLSDIVQFNENQFRFFCQQLERMTTTYDEIFFDMGAGISATSMNILLSVDEVIVVTTPEPTAVMDAYSAIKLVLTKMPEKRVSVLVNRCQKRYDGEDTWQKLSSTTKRFLHKDIHLLGFVPEDRHVQLSVMDQTPFSIKYPHSQVTKAIHTISKGLLGVKDSERGFIHRLKKLFLKG